MEINWPLHYSNLSRMYTSAPINQWYLPHIQISEGVCEISVAVEEKYFHAAGAVHGSVYFKLLDDTAFFAANSLEPEVFVLTTAFTTYLTRPVSQGRLKAVGRVVNRNKSQFICESLLMNDQDQELGRGSGIFVRSKSLLRDVPGYLG